MEHPGFVNKVSRNEKCVKELYTNDLSFTAYLMLRGYKVTSAKALGKSYKFSVLVGDEEEDHLRIDYVNSEIAKFDAAVRDLKKILFSGDK